MKGSMKKAAAGMVMAVAVLLGGMTGVHAEEFNPGCQFVDEDKDGICDNYTSERPRKHCQENGKGTCSGAKFLDADGDGICDHYTEGQARSCGRRSGGRHGRNR